MSHDFLWLNCCVYVKLGRRRTSHSSDSVPKVFKWTSGGKFGTPMVQIFHSIPNAKMDASEDITCTVSKVIVFVIAMCQKLCHSCYIQVVNSLWMATREITLNVVTWATVTILACLSWIPSNLSFRYTDCSGQFTGKMKGNAEPQFAFIFVVNWLWYCGVTGSFGCFFFSLKKMWRNDNFHGIHAI